MRPLVGLQNSDCMAKSDALAKSQVAPSWYKMLRSRFALSQSHLLRCSVSVSVSVSLLFSVSFSLSLFEFVFF